MNTIKIIELFGGIGACTQAMKRLGIDFEVVDYVEIDKYAVKSYNAINSTKYEPQDITQWDKDIKADFIMHGSPCQDFSVAGLGKGASEDGGTRSSLMYETIRIVDKVRPKYVLWENVKNVLSKKHRHNFDNYLSKMEELGYHNYYQVLNAKDYGVPQNRERIFVLSCLEDIDYKFPQKQELAIRLKDILEDEVDEKYYISSDKVEKLVKQIVEKQGDKGLGALISQATSTGSIYCKNGGVLNMAYPESDTRRGRVISDGNVCGTIECADHIGRLEIEKVLVDDTNSEKFGNCRLYKDNAPSLRSQRQGQKVVEIQQLGNINPSGHGQNGSVVSNKGLARTVTVEKGEGQKICCIRCLRPERTEYGKEIRKKYESGEINESRHNMTVLCPRKDEVTNTITTVQKDNYIISSEKFVCPILTPDRLEKRQNGRRCKEDGEPMFTLTGQDRHGVIVVEVPTEVEVRKYDVDVEKLKVILIDAKKNSGLTINQISKEINVSKTKVEHWFRKDDCFSIPDKEVWFGLKDLLNISTDEFDLPVTEFIVKENAYDMANRFYHVNGIAPTLTCGIVPNIIGNAYVIYIRKLTPKECWRLMGFSDKCFEKAAEVNSNSQLYKQAGNSIVVDVLENIFINLFVENKMETYIPLGQDGIDGQMSIFDL